MDRGQLQNDPEIAQRAALDGRQAEMYTSMPGIVTAVNFADNTVDVQPAIKAEVTDENGKTEWVNLPKLIHCPVQFPRGGGFTLTFPVAVNDEVLINWACRAIDAWWQSGGIQKPIEMRMHDLSDGFALLGFSSKPHAIANVATTAVQLRNDAKTSYFQIAADGKTTVVSGSEVDLTAPLVKITGNLTVSGTIVAQGEVTANGTTPLHTHIHGGVTGGPSNTGPPTV